MNRARPVERQHLFPEQRGDVERHIQHILAARILAYDVAFASRIRGMHEAHKKARIIFQRDAFRKLLEEFRILPASQEVRCASSFAFVRAHHTAAGRQVTRPE